MKLFKKMLVLLLVLSMVMALVACGDDDDDDDAKEGSSRKKDKTEQVTKEPTDDPDPTDAPDPTDEPTPIPTVEPVSTPSPTPTPTEAPAPTDAPNPISGDLTADKLIGTWQGSMTASVMDFVELSGEALDDESMQAIEIMISSMNEVGIKNDFKLEISIEFKDDRNCAFTMKGDGMDFYNGVKKLLSTEDGLCTFFAKAIGVDKETAKAYIALYGQQQVQDLINQMLGKYSADSFCIEETKEKQYKIEDNKVKMTGEDALGYFIYDAAKGGLVIGTDDTSADSQKIVKLLSGIVLKKK